MEVHPPCWNTKATLVSTVGPAVPVNRCTGAWDVHFQKQTVWLFFCRTLTAEVSWADLLQWWIIQFYCSSSRLEKREFGKRGRERQINFLWSQFCSVCVILCGLPSKPWTEFCWTQSNWIQWRWIEENGGLLRQREAWKERWRQPSWDWGRKKRRHRGRKLKKYIYKWKRKKESQCWCANWLPNKRLD